MKQCFRACCTAVPDPAAARSPLPDLVTAAKYDKAVVEEEEIPLEKRAVARAGGPACFPAFSLALLLIALHLHSPSCKGLAKCAHCSPTLPSLHAACTLRFAVDTRRNDCSKFCRQDGCQEAAGGRCAGADVRQHCAVHGVHAGHHCLLIISCSQMLPDG